MSAVPETTALEREADVFLVTRVPAGSMDRFSRILSAICPFTGLEGGEDRRPVAAGEALLAHAQGVHRMIEDQAAHL
ncbi:MAG: hypothetical protein ACM33U_09005 [Solirubrobacterales bacterium]|nr:hypothetical protein [Solirubrobacterales bacterium]